MDKRKNQILRFRGKIIIKIKLKLLTGLHIGTAREVAKIGGVDNPVIKDPVTQEPYIPGSSLKGKLRSLLEKSLEKTEENQEIHVCDQTDCKICRIFGSDKLGEGKLIFRDFYLTEDWRKKFEKRIQEGEKFFEEKMENKVNRLTGQASDPRTMERVPKDTEFEGELIYNFIKRPGQQEDFLEKDLKNLSAGFKLLEDDYLGGSGSRGYGKIKVIIEKVLIRKKGYYFEKEEEKEIKEELGLETNFNLEKIKEFIEK